MYKSILFLVAAAFTAVQADTSFSPVRRQLVPVPCSESGLKDCGAGCIELTWTCCPGGAGGCPPTEYCSGPTACCPLGEVCTGPGGVETIPGGTLTFVSTIEIPGETSTIELTSTIDLTSTIEVPVETSTAETEVETSIIIETSTAVIDYPTTATSPTKPTTPTNGTIPSASPTVSQFPGAADKTQIFAPLNLLAFLLPFLFA